ncbi:hypothetical protein AVEN_171434-1 [Araneus ventricosus]|uniref:Uncharacterized protein n=1 Tax=Araneus ventricosus TaxID=182803 RepID=A0A4Y2D3R4_ARAVE|nr:hypothetical protein AVEN_171434-1 [Araneus ventricosus]
MQIQFVRDFSNCDVVVWTKGEIDNSDKNEPNGLFQWVYPKTQVSATSPLTLSDIRRRIIVACASMIPNILKVWNMEFKQRSICEL